MVHTDEIRTGSRCLVRLQDDRERSVLFYTLRRFKKSQRQGGPGRQKGEDRGIPVGVSRGTGGGMSGRRRRCLRIPCRPLRISDRLGRSLSRSASWMISVGCWRSFSACRSPCWTSPIRRERRHVQTPVLIVQVVRRCVFMVRRCMWRLCSQCDLVRFYGGINGATNICSFKCFSIFYDYTKVYDLLLRILQYFNGGLTTTVR